MLSPIPEPPMMLIALAIGYCIITSRRYSRRFLARR